MNVNASGKEKKDMSIKELIIVNLLLLKGVCTSFTQALACVMNNGTPDEIERIASKIVQSFARSLNLIGNKADLYMGATNVPFDKQSSLRLFKKTVSAKDVAEAVIRVFMMENDRTPNEKTEREAIIGIYKYIEPIFVVLDVPMAEEDVVEAVYAYGRR